MPVKRSVLFYRRPIFEEGSKGLGLLVLLLFFRRYFDDILDGIVFAGVIAIGFATVENVLYYGSAYRSSGWEGIKFLFLLRGILSPFAHATFTSMTGIGCGISRESHNRAVKILAPVVGYFLAVTLHATWNSLAGYSLYIFEKLDVDPCAVIGNPELPLSLCSFLDTYAVLQVPLFLIIVGFALYIMRRQNKILKEMLAIELPVAWSRRNMPKKPRRRFAAQPGCSAACLPVNSRPAAIMSGPSATRPQLLAYPKSHRSPGPDRQLSTKSHPPRRGPQMA